MADKTPIKISGGENRSKEINSKKYMESNDGKVSTRNTDKNEKKSKV
jgi:hypothetical protein